MFIFYDHSLCKYSCHFIFTLLHKQCYVSTESISNEATIIPGCRTISSALEAFITSTKGGGHGIAGLCICIRVFGCDQNNSIGYKAILMKFSE